MEQKQLIEKAIEYHGRKELPEDLDDGCLLLSKLIRDAEKIFGYVDSRLKRETGLSLFD